ncbi:MAG: TonB-dependent receptor, partial [Bacteroidota bacterium]
MPCLRAQTLVTGVVSDANTNEPLTGASVSIQSTGVITDTEGKFSLSIPASYTGAITFSYTGYQTQTAAVSNTLLLIKLLPAQNQLDEAVVTSSRNNTELKRQTVSVDVIKPYLVENKITANMENIMNQLPSVNVIDGQVNIRSGSGWTYGAGSRVLILVDDVPLLTGDAGQAQWKFMPTDNIASMEVIKGASSVMYGSSALNGIINIRTAAPSTKGKFSANVFTGLYSKPARDSARWWNGARFYKGANTFYSKRFNRLDLTLGLNALDDDGYRLGEYDKRARVTAKTNYRFKSIPGLRAGVDAAFMKQQSASFLLWESFAYGYTALDSAQTQTRATVFSIDPHADWTFAKIKLRYRGRYYGIDNNIEESTPGTDQDNSSINSYNELAAHYFLGKNLGTIATGITHNYTLSKSPLYGNKDQTASNYAGFVQLDLQRKRWSMNAGGRYEHFTMNAFNDDVLIGRFGAGYEATKSTFLRTSIGQGYRYPTIAERYIETSVGLINIFPNPDLKPEKGYSAEIGLKQGFKLGQVTGYIDAAYFYTEYDDMVEFNFGQWRNRVYTGPPPGLIDLRNIGFKSFNIGRTRISGIDVALFAGYQAKNMEWLAVAGYTYSNPVMLEPTTTFAVDSSSNKNQYTYNYTSTDTMNNPLKYRYDHMAKIDVQVTWKKRLMLGVSFRYNSYMKNIDKVFVTFPVSYAVPDVARGRELNRDGDFVTDVRAAYTIKRFTLTATVNNLFNTEIMSRPA